MDLTTVHLPEALARSVDEIAKQRHVSRSDVVREALEQYCERASKFDPSDAQHAACTKELPRLERQCLVTSLAVVTEATHLAPIH